MASRAKRGTVSVDLGADGELLDILVAELRAFLPLEFANRAADINRGSVMRAAFFLWVDDYKRRGEYGIAARLVLQFGGCGQRRTATHG